MVSPLQRLNSVGNQGVVIYAPGRGLPRRPAPAPTRRTGGTQRVPARAARERTTGVNWNAVEQAFAPAREKRAAQEEQEQAEAEQPWYRRGLGMVLGNPIAQAALQPLEEIDKMRRIVTLGVSEASEALPQTLRGAIPVINMTDPERIAADERSNLEKINDPSYGFGQIAKQTGNQWADRTAGFVGDVALDPTTYLTMGATKAVGSGGRVALQAGRAARASELAALSRRLAPEVLEQLGPDIVQAGRRGLGTASPALREALGISAPEIRFMGKAIPGSRAVAEPLSQLGGAIRAQTTGRIANPLARGPKGLEAALGTITRGTGEMEVPRALQNIALTEDIRLGEGAFTTRGNRLITDTYRNSLRGLDREAVQQMIRDTEAGLDTPLKQFFDTVPQVYKDISGRDIEPFMRERYFPHVMTGGARRMLRKALDKNDPLVRDMVEKGWFATDDLLEGSGFLERARQLTPNPDGSPRTITLGGREVTISSGTLDEVNTELRKLFPGFRGDFYETDPVKVMESYVNSVARQAGRDKALGMAASGPTDLVQRIEGDLATELEQRNDQLAARAPMVDEIMGGFEKGAPLRPVPDAAEPVEPSGIFRSREMSGKTTERNQRVISEGKKYRKAAAEESRELRTEAVQTLRDVRQNMMQGLKDEAKANSPRIRELDRIVEGHRATLQQLRESREINHQELTAFMVGIRKDIADLEDEMRKVRVVYKGKLTKEQNRIERKLRSSLETMREVSRRADERLAAAPRELRDEARRRVDELMRPVERARAAVRAKAAEVPGRVDPERLSWANSVISRGRNDGAFEALNESYRQALQKVERLRVRMNSKLPKGIQDQVEQFTVEQKAAFRQAMQDDLTAAGADAARIRREIETYVPMSQFEQDLSELYALRAIAGDTPNPRLQELERMFRRSGKHYEEQRARDILKDHASWEVRVAHATRDLEEKARNLEFQVTSSPEFALVEQQAKRQYSRLEGQARARAQRLASEEAAVARMDDPTITRRGGRSGFNPERDIEARQRIEGERDAIMGPLIEQREMATGVRDEVLEATRDRLRTMDDDIINTQARLQQDLAEKTNLEAHREAAAQRLAVAKKARVDKWRPTDDLMKADEDLLAVARTNPRLDDDALNVTESLLSTAHDQLARSKDLAIRAEDVQKIIDLAFDNKLQPILLTTVNDGWRMLHDGPLQAGDIVVDAELYRRYELLYEGMKDPKLGGRVLNAFTNLFKTYATLTPGFHVRNAMSAWFMNTSDGVPQRLQLEGARLWQKYMKGGEQWLASQPEDIRTAFDVAMGSGAGGRFTEAGVAQSADSPLYDRLARNRATRWSQRQGERVEGGIRMGMALDSIRKGETPQAALARVTRVHFDYGQVSKFDEQAKRLVPFWTFMSRNIPLQVMQMWTKPRIYQRYNSLVRNFSEEPEEYTPRYWLDSGAFNTGQTFNDMPVYLQPDFAHARLGQDYADIERFLAGEDMGGVLSNINPIVSAPIEFAMGRDIFTGQEFGPSDYSDVGGPLGLPAKALATVLGQTNETGQVSDNFMNVLRSLNPLQDRSSRLLPQLSGGDEEAQRRQPESIARFLGVPVRTLTEKQQQNEYFRRYYDALEEQERIRKMLEGTRS